MKQNLITDVIQGMLPYLNWRLIISLHHLVWHTIWSIALRFAVFT